MAQSVPGLIFSFGQLTGGRSMHSRSQYSPQAALQVRTQDILRFDRGRELGFDSARRATVVGLSFSFSFPCNSAEPSALCVRTIVTLLRMLCAFSPLTPEFIDLKCRDSVLVTTIPSKVRHNGPLCRSLKDTNYVLEETQPPPSHSEGHPVRQAHIHELADRICRDCAD
jgi:hypothetical protein